MIVVSVLQTSLALQSNHKLLKFLLLYKADTTPVYFFHCKRAIITKSKSLTDTKLFKHIQNIKNLMYILEMLEQKQVYCSVNGQLLHS